MSEKSREKQKNANPVIAINRRASHDFHLFERFEAGLALVGTEVKSLRQHLANLREAYADVVDGQAWLRQCHINEYAFGNRFNHLPLRSRRLLLHKAELRRLEVKTVQQGYTIIPTRLYFKQGRVKVELALAKGKKLYDKRQDLKRDEAQREMDRAQRGKD